MYKLFIVLRYLRRNWLNIVGTLAVAVAVLVPICVLSVMKGFDEEFRSRMRATLSDLIVEGRSEAPFGGCSALMARIGELPHVVACAPQFEWGGFLIMKTGSRRVVKRVEFHGIDLDLENQATDFADFWRAWRGRLARQELAGLLAYDSALESASRTKVVEVLSHMRTDDLSLLNSADRKAVIAWAKRNSVDLAATLREGDGALPDWGPPGDPRQSPAIAGEELLVLAQDAATGRLLTVPVGSQVTVVSVPMSDINERTFRQCRIAGEFRSGISEYDANNIYLPLADVQKFMMQEGKEGKEGNVTSISVRLDSYAHAQEVRAALLGILTPEEVADAVQSVRPLLRKENPQAAQYLDKQFQQFRQRVPKLHAEGNELGVAFTHSMQDDLERVIAEVLHSAVAPAEGTAARARLESFQTKLAERKAGAIGDEFRVRTWEDKRRTFLRAVALERHVMAFILFFVILIAGTLILSILHTTVLSKTRDIGTLKSIGGSVRGIMSIFLLNGLCMGVIGSAIGAALGFLVTKNIDAIQSVIERAVGFSLFPADIYLLERIPVDKHPWPSVIFICVTAVAVSLAASLYPAWKAARMDAVEALRYE